MVLDEGGAVVEPMFPGMNGSAAVVGIAEKGYLLLVLSARDSRHWSSGGARNVFRFTPFPYERDWMSRAHGTDERLSVEGLADGVRFHVQLVLNAERI